MSEETLYPEHEKLREIKHLSQEIHDFLEWAMCHHGLLLSVPNKEHERTGCYVPMSPSIRNLLAEYFEIDLDKIEEEKRAMLAGLKEMNARD